MGKVANELLEGLNRNSLFDLKREIERRLHMGVDKAYEETEKASDTTAYVPEMSMEKKLEWLFTYHSDASKNPKYEAINTATKHCAEIILRTVEDCKDRDFALEHVRDARMRANAAVACDGIGF